MKLLKVNIKDKTPMLPWLLEKRREEREKSENTTVVNINDLPNMEKLDRAVDKALSDIRLENTPFDV